MAKLKCAATGEVCDVIAIETNSDPMVGKLVTGLRFRDGAWDTILIQAHRPGLAPEALWVPAEPGKDY